MWHGHCSRRGEEEPAVGKGLGPGALISEGAAHQRSWGRECLASHGKERMSSGQEPVGEKRRHPGPDQADLLCPGKQLVFILSSRRSLERALSRGMV